MVRKSMEHKSMILRSWRRKWSKSRREMFQHSGLRINTRSVRKARSCITIIHPHHVSSCLPRQSSLEPSLRSTAGEKPPFPIRELRFPFICDSSIIFRNVFPTRYRLQEHHLISNIAHDHCGTVSTHLTSVRCSACSDHILGAARIDQSR